MVIAMFLAAQALTPPTGARWLTVHRDEQSEHAIDPDSISRRGDRISAIVRARILRPQAGGPGTGVMRYEYDCRANTVRWTVSDLYDGNGSFAGTVVRPEAEQLNLPIPPNSPHAGVVAHLCR